MAAMLLVHQVCELDKTTLGDVAFEKINNLTFDQVMEIIKSKDRNEVPLAWDLQDYLELQELRVCCKGVTTPYKNLCDALSKIVGYDNKTNEWNPDTFNELCKHLESFKKSNQNKI